MDRHDRWARRLDPELADGLGSPEDDLLPHEEAALARVAGTLTDEATWAGPSAGVRESLLSAVAAEAATRSTPPAGDAPGAELTGGTHTSRARPRSPIARSARWLSLAAAAVLVVGGVLVLRPDHHGPAASFTAAGTPQAPKATAVVQLTPKPAGVAIRLVIKGLPPAPKGSYYAAWVRGQAGTVPVGTFHWHVGGHPVDLWSGVDFKGYPELFVTLQHEGDNPSPSGPTVLDGTLPQS